MPLNLPRVSTAVASPSLSGPTHMLCHCHSSLTTPAPHHPNRSYIRSIMRFLILTLTLPAMAAAAACSSDCEKEFTGTVTLGEPQCRVSSLLPFPPPCLPPCLSPCRSLLPLRRLPRLPIPPRPASRPRDPNSASAPDTRPHPNPLPYYPTSHNPQPTTPTPLHHTRCLVLSHTRRGCLAPHTLTRSLHPATPRTSLRPATHRYAPLPPLQVDASPSSAAKPRP